MINKTIITELGTIQTGELSTDDIGEWLVGITIDILSLSDEIKTEVEKAIEIEKVNYVKEWEEYVNKNPTAAKRIRKWSDKPVSIFGQYIKIYLEGNKPFESTICVAFEDADDELIETGIYIPVDLSAYEEEIKDIMINLLFPKR